MCESVDVHKARLYFCNGDIVHYEDQKLAYAVWLSLPKGARTAFRRLNDGQPVYPWDYADVLPTEGL